MDLTVTGKKNFSVALSVPGDKSISHRALIIGAIARGDTKITGFLPSEDCLSTLRCLEAMGVEIDMLSETELVVHGKGLFGLKEPEDVLYVGNSGTTIRLLAGLLAGQEFFSVLTGDASIRRRPMGRVVHPLRLMGACIEGRKGGDMAPLALSGRPLRGISYETPVASAQVKSALLLAGLYARGETTVTEPVLSRDHTERMLGGFGARLERNGTTVSVSPGELTACDIDVPGDISSAAFFIVAGAIRPQAKVTVKNVGLNTTRTGILDVLKDMGARIEISDVREVADEPRGDITVTADVLHGVTIGGELIPRLVDEIPVLAVAAALAEGKTVIRDAAELKVKESNRILAIATELARFGVDITDTEDGLIIKGGHGYKGAVCESYGDHRIAMACALMGLASEGETVVKDAECIAVSFPDFFEKLALLR